MVVSLTPYFRSFIIALYYLNKSITYLVLNEETRVFRRLSNADTVIKFDLSSQFKAERMIDNISLTNTKKKQCEY